MLSVAEVLCSASIHAKKVHGACSEMCRHPDMF